MKQLHVIPYYDPAIEFGGVQTVCRHLVDSMVARGHHVTVLTTDVASRRNRLSNLRELVRGAEVVRVRNVSQRLVGANVYTPRHFAKALRELLPDHDIVHVHDVFNWLTVRTSRELARARTPSVLSTDGLFSFDPRRGRARMRQTLFRLFGRRVVSRFDAVHAVRPEELDGVELGIPAERMRYIANGVPYPPTTGNGDRFRARWGLANRPIVLFVGQLLPMKGVDLLTTLAQEHVGPTSPVFVFAGQRPDGPPVVPGAWSAPNVLYVGFLNGPDLADAYAAASLYVLPSYFDVMPNTLLDALAHGVPSLVTRQCLLPELGEVGAGILIESNIVVAALRLPAAARQARLVAEDGGGGAAARRSPVRADAHPRSVRSHVRRARSPTGERRRRLGPTC